METRIIKCFTVLYTVSSINRNERRFVYRMDNEIDEVSVGELYWMKRPSAMDLH